LPKKKTKKNNRLSEGPQKTQKPLKKIIRPTPSRPSAFPIVGIGASAGGLEAFMEMFRSLPPDTGMAFILIQHLSPQHFSMLSTFIQKVTRMQVQEAVEGVKVEANHVYVIPPSNYLELFHGKLHLTPMPVPHAGTMAVNSFLTSLARDQGNLAVGIILSGTGTDGTEGLKDIKADGGITFVQDPKTAKYNGMPNAAIAGVKPDHVLSVENIAKELIRIAGNPIVQGAATSDDSNPDEETKQLLQRIFILVRSATKIDFSTYKYPTIIRRVRRRMVLHRLESLKHYLSYLQANPAEVRALFDDLLINVTDFFRDAEAFEALKEKTFPNLLQVRAPGTPIRVWVPGCATGEEVYSIAIALLEFLGATANQFPIQIYGTDICEPAIKIARLGVYPESASKNLTPARIERFFQKDTNGGYRVSKAVRDCCIFSIQDVTSHPPINRLDLLSCRNLMIYLGAVVQKKLMETFFYALNSNGYLFLGSSESVGPAASLFSIVDKKNKIYSKKSALSAQSRIPSESAPETHSNHFVLPTPPALPLKSIDPIVEAERMVLENYAPAWVLVNQTLDIVQFKGATGNFIEPASGQPTWNLMKMLRSGLSPEVRVLIHAALKEGAPARKNGIKVKVGALERLVDVEASPIAGTHCLIIFMDQKGKLATTTTQRKGKQRSNPLLVENEALRKDLVMTQKSLQSIVEDQNATNEEMQSANEEVLSANEELQSTNEELETAKEELQSTNEELTSLNDELSSRNRELDHLNDDLTNVLSNVNVSIVMVGNDLKIKRFTPMAEKLLKLIPADVGRNLTDINIGLMIDKLEDRIADVIRTVTPAEFDTQDRHGCWYAIKIRPYRTIEGRISGAVIVFTNIDDIKTREREVREKRRYSEGIIQTVRDPLIVLDEKLRVESANQAFYDTFKIAPSVTIGHLFYEIGEGHWNGPELRTLLEDVLPKQKEVRDFRLTKDFPELGKKTLILNARALEWEGQIKLLILISLHDLSDQTGSN
jgi:two-component system CheB/CheR fusion protein